MNPNFRQYKCMVAITAITTKPPTKIHKAGPQMSGVMYWLRISQAGSASIFGDTMSSGLAAVDGVSLCGVVVGSDSGLAVGPCTGEGVVVASSKGRGLVVECRKMGLISSSAVAHITAKPKSTVTAEIFIFSGG